MNNIDIFLAIFLGILLYIDFVSIKRNREIAKSVKKTEMWCRSILNDIINEETRIDKELERLIEKNWNNQVSNDVNLVKEEGESHKITMCPYHYQVIQDLSKHQAELDGDIKLIRKQKDNMLEFVREKLETSPEDLIEKDD